VSDQEKLEKLDALMLFAIKNGWKSIFGTPYIRAVKDATTGEFFFAFEGHKGGSPLLMSVASVILGDHDFARALFGEAGQKPGEQDWPFTYVWEQHLALAVISDNPIDYMYKAVFGGESD
jgi:hypothetical protein